LQQRQIATEGLFADSNRPTTLKVRIGAASQQIVRLDYEDSSELSPKLEKAIYSHLKKRLPSAMR
jgi:bifunctional ADP-heptose synthase (sugar kinase/adenylyltransferase)